MFGSDGPGEPNEPFRALDVLGVGLVSAGGFTARDHVFFARAGLIAPSPSPFIDREGEVVRLRFCPWLDCRIPFSERLMRLGEVAISQAREPIARAALPDVELCLVAPELGPALTEVDLEALKKRLRGASEAAGIRTFTAAAGTFVALQHASRVLYSGQASAVLLVAVDSHTHADLLAEDHERLRSVWRPGVPPLGEAAAALLLALPGRAPVATPALATVLGVETAIGRSHDLNDEIVDGKALTLALRRLPQVGGVPMVFGPITVDPLRRSEWNLASARHARFIASPYAMTAIEEEIGRVGAAAGAAYLVHGISACWHQAVHAELPANAPFYAWAISRGGQRGVALVQGGGA